MLECVMLSSDADKARWVKDYIEPAIERGDVENYEAKLKKTMGSAPAKKKKTKGSGKRKMEEEVDDDESDSGSESDTPVAMVVEEGDEEVDRGVAKGTKENNTNKSKKKAAAAKKKSSSAKAAKPSKKKAASSDDDLIAQIRGNSLARSRQAGFDSLMSGLEEKYGGKKKKGKKKQKDDDGDIDDDEFAKIQAKMMKNKKSR